MNENAGAAVAPIPTTEQVRTKLAAWFPDLKSPTVDKLSELHALLVKFNKAINLVSPLTLRSAESLHFADSIFASRLVYSSLVADAPVADVGSGNGFPGLVFGILYPGIKVVLIDRDLRKSEYLKAAVAQLKIANVTIDVRPLETLPLLSLKNVTLRGFAPLAKAMLILRKQVALGGRCFHLKGDGFANELAQVPSQVFSVWSPSLLGQYKLPEGGAELSVILTEKIAE